MNRRGHAPTLHLPVAGPVHSWRTGKLPAAALTAALDRAVEGGALDPQAVIIDVRSHNEAELAPVVPIGALTKYDRPAPQLDAYDQLLTGSNP